jgi:hypothetical protein
MQIEWSAKPNATSDGFLDDTFLIFAKVVPEPTHGPLGHTMVITREHVEDDWLPEYIAHAHRMLTPTSR